MSSMAQLALCPGFHGAETKMVAFLRGGSDEMPPNSFRWHNAGSCRVEVPTSLLAVSWGSLLASKAAYMPLLPSSFRMSRSEAGVHPTLGILLIPPTSASSLLCLTPAFKGSSDYIRPTPVIQRNRLISRSAN